MARLPMPLALGRLLAAVGIALAVCFGGVACDRGGGGDDGQPPVVLDGTPRIPDDEGVATALTTSSITLDDERTYPVSRRLVSFSTYNAAIEPMLNRKGHYVQIGTEEEDGREVMVWMAGIATVVRTAEPSVYYTGTLREVKDGRLIFRDGTVFRLADGIDPAPPTPPASVFVRIDPARHVVVEVKRQ